MSQAYRQLPGVAIVPFMFGQTDVAASQTAVALQAPLAEAAGAVIGLTMPTAGEVLYVAINTSAAGTDGLATAAVTLDTVATAATVALADDAVANTATVNRGNPVTFAAGDVLGVDLTTDGDWDATTADVLVTVYVALWP